jgi:hypothetical protein
MIKRPTDMPRPLWYAIKLTALLRPITERMWTAYGPGYRYIISRKDVLLPVEKDGRVQFNFTEPTRVAHLVRLCPFAVVSLPSGLPVFPGESITLLIDERGRPSYMVGPLKEDGHPYVAPL